MKRVHLFITGDVIGVGFRAYIKNHANKLNLTGFARNVYHPKKGVECVVEGEEEKINQLIKECKKGPEISLVKNVSITWRKPTGGFYVFKVI